jgi:hypothetical protein
MDIFFAIVFAIFGVMAWLTLLFSISRNKWPVTVIIASLMVFCAVASLALLGVI